METISLLLVVSLILTAFSYLISKWMHYKFGILCFRVPVINLIATPVFLVMLAVYVIYVVLELYEEEDD